MYDFILVSEFCVFEHTWFVEVYEGAVVVSVCMRLICGNNVVVCGVNDPGGPILVDERESVSVLLDTLDCGRDKRR